MTEALSVMLAIVLIVVAAGLYLLPGIIASHRGHRNAGPIWLVNIFLGWSGLGWFAALIWACTDNVDGRR